MALHSPFPLLLQTVSYPSLVTKPYGRRFTVPSSAQKSSQTMKETGYKIQKERVIEFTGLHHVGFLCANLERSLEFYCGTLGLTINNARPEDKLPYRGAWLWVGDGMLHLMELPNPDPLTGRPQHGGRDRHACVTVKDVTSLKHAFEEAGISYTLSKSGRPAIFARDPDGNALEFAEDAP